jgi:hypothetical protein
MKNLIDTQKPVVSGKYLTTEAIIQYGELLGNEIFYTLLREKRNAVLKASDWSVGEDSPLDNSTKQLWIAYRQALRDLPQNTPNINSINWPQHP